MTKRMHPMTEMSLRNRSLAHRMAARGTPVEFIARWMDLPTDCINAYLLQPRPDDLPEPDSDDSWMDRGICRTVDPDLWFSTGVGQSNQLRTAKRLCQSCPVIDRCRAWGLAHREEWGVWGGLDATDRGKLLKQDTDAA